MGIAINFSAKKYNPAIFGPKKIIINVVIPIFEKELKRFAIDENFKKSMYFLKFFLIIFMLIKEKSKSFKKLEILKNEIIINEITFPIISPKLTDFIPKIIDDPELDPELGSESDQDSELLAEPHAEVLLNVIPLRDALNQELTDLTVACETMLDLVDTYHTAKLKQNVLNPVCATRDVICGSSKCCCKSSVKPNADMMF